METGIGISCIKEEDEIGFSSANYNSESGSNMLLDEKFNDSSL